MAYVPDPTDATQPVESVFVKTAAAEFRALKAYVQALASAGGVGVATPGQIAMFIGDTPPAGWLELNGSLKVRATFPNLYAAVVAANAITLDTTWNSGYIGYYSQGDGSSTFRLPDFRGLFIRAWNHGKVNVACDPGRQMGLYQGGTVFFDNFGNAASAVVTPITGQFVTSADQDIYPANVQGWNVTTPAGYSVTAVKGVISRPNNITAMYCVKT